MSPSLYLINPAADFATYFSAEVFSGSGLKPATLMADLAIPTLAGLAPSDFALQLCDENIEPIDFETPADFVGITGKITQWRRMMTIARKFRERGKIVLMGGPYASLCPEVVRPHCDILVQGETEEIFANLCSDLRSGCWKPEYTGGRPDLARCQLPNWNLYLNDRALMGTIQTSRGCPFECEFCDVIQYVGRQQRHKSVAQVLGELDEICRFGYRSIFLADDNFTVWRSRAKELLDALRHWNLKRKQGPVRFVTQVSIDAAKDEELLQMCAAAGLTQVFIGIETPNEESLRETRKRQNLGLDLVEQVQRFVDHGICVTGGMIVGFDSDRADIFERQYEFAMSTPVPIYSVGALVAPAATPLHSRMASESRLVSEGSEVAAMPWNTNIVPRHMTREQLLGGIQWLCANLYQPFAFADRVLRFIDRLGKRRDPRHAARSWDLADLRPVEYEGFALLSKLVRSGREEADMWSRIRRGIADKPEAAEFVFQMLFHYLQIRHMYERAGFLSLASPRS